MVTVLGVAALAWFGAVSLRFIPFCFHSKGAFYRLHPGGIERFRAGKQVWSRHWNQVTFVAQHRQLIRNRPRLDAMAIMDTSGQFLDTIRFNDFMITNRPATTQPIQVYLAHHAQQIDLPRADRKPFPESLWRLQQVLLLAGSVLLLAFFLGFIPATVLPLTAFIPHSSALLGFGVALLAQSLLLEKYFRSVEKRTTERVAHLQKLGDEPIPTRAEMVPGQWYGHKDRNAEWVSNLSLREHLAFPIIFGTIYVGVEAWRRGRDGFSSDEVWGVCGCLVIALVIIAFSSIAGRDLLCRRALIRREGDSLRVRIGNKEQEFPVVPLRWARHPFERDWYRRGFFGFWIEPFSMEPVAEKELETHAQPAQPVK